MATRQAWRSVHPDLRSSHGYRWPFPGHDAVAPLPAGAEFTSGDPCPQFVGDGLCLAKTWRGAASGGIPAITCLLVSYRPGDVLGEDEDKVRVSSCVVLDVFDAAGLIRDGWCEEADLSGANLSGANLSGANLYRANLSRANLYRANLSRADLYGADLTGATLYGADLCGANLYGADLSGADLTGATLSGADLCGARADRYTRWPAGFDPKAAGVLT